MQQLLKYNFENRPDIHLPIHNITLDSFLSFSPLQSNLYPAVGLQTPGEIVDTNFGQSPFVFNVEDLMQVS